MGHDWKGQRTRERRPSDPHTAVTVCAGGRGLGGPGTVTAAGSSTPLVLSSSSCHFMERDPFEGVEDSEGSRRDQISQSALRGLGYCQPNRPLTSLFLNKMFMLILVHSGSRLWTRQAKGRAMGGRLVSASVGSRRGWGCGVGAGRGDGGRSPAAAAVGAHPEGLS